MPKQHFVVALVGLVSLFSILACSDDGQTPVAQPTAEATATRAPEATVTPTASPQPRATETPQEESSEPAQGLAPLNLDDPRALLSDLSDGERSCLADKNIGAAQIIAASADRIPPTDGDAIIDCLEDETVLRLVFSEPLTATGELSTDTTACIREGFGAIDLRPIAKFTGGEPLALEAQILGLAGLLTFTTCLNDEEWQATAHALGLGTQDEAEMDCLLTELDGPRGVAKALLRTDESGLPRDFIDAAVTCDVSLAETWVDMSDDIGSVGIDADTLHPLAIEDPQAFLSGLSPTEQSCLGDKGLGSQELSQMTGHSPGGSPETTAEIVNCLQDDTVLRLFLTTLVGQVEPFSQETSSCIREAFGPIDLRSLLASAIAGSTPANPLALGMAALNVSAVCMNDEEWEAQAPMLGMRPEDREIGACLFEVLGGPAKLTEAMLSSSSGEMPEDFIRALEACGVETSLNEGPPTYEGHEASPLWTFTAGAKVLTTPVIADGVVYVGSDDGNLYALAADTGKKLWSFATDDMIRSVPSVVDGRVYFGSNDNHLYALDAATGVELWRYDTGGLVQYSPVVGNGMVYFPARGKSDRTVHAVDVATGEVVWVAKPPYPIDERLAPTIHGDRVYAQGAEYGAFYALDAASGEIAWQAEVEGYAESAPTVLDGMIYLTVINQAYAFEEATGGLIWSVNAEEFPTPGFPALVVDGIYYLATSYYVYALDAATGEEKWGYDRWGLHSAPVVADGVLYGAPELAEFLIALDALTGEVLWASSPADDTNHDLSVVDGVLYGQTSWGGFLFAVDSKDGTILPWEFDTGGFKDIPPYVVSDGVVYAAGPGNSINALPAPTGSREE